MQFTPELRSGFAQHVQEMGVKKPMHGDRALTDEIMNHHEPDVRLGILIINTASAHHVNDKDWNLVLLVSADVLAAWCTVMTTSEFH